MSYSATPARRSGVVVRIFLVAAALAVIATPWSVSIHAAEKDSAAEDAAAEKDGVIKCAGVYAHHLQGVCTEASQAIYWSFTTTLVKTDFAGRVLKSIPVANHHGDLCHAAGKIYVAVNLGKFNDPAGNADSWVYVYDAKTLSLLAKHETQEVFHGAGGIGCRGGRFFVVGGLPDGVPENYVYEYDADFSFVAKHVIPSGHTVLGIQTATFSAGSWWFGCYGGPQILLKTDANFKMQGRYEFDASLGIVGRRSGGFLVAKGWRIKGEGNYGQLAPAVADEKKGLVFQAAAN